MAKTQLRELHPAGLFPVSIVSVKEDSSTFGPVYKITLLSEHGSEVMLCSQTYAPGSRFGKLVKAALGSLPKSLDTDDLAGKQVHALVIHEDKDGGTFAKVTELLPVPGQDPFAGQ